MKILKLHDKLRCVILRKVLSLDSCFAIRRRIHGGSQSILYQDNETERLISKMFAKIMLFERTKLGMNNMPQCF
ncbi:hypothetical protein HZS_748 [Henneguya salminicola]|nr:hypothetical protein HZS_748 [Henneguya salminicola]